MENQKHFMKRNSARTTGGSKTHQLNTRVAEKRRHNNESRSLSTIAASSKNLRYVMSPMTQVITNPQPLITIKLTGQSQAVTTTSTGVVSRSYSLNPALVNTFSTRWGAVFREFLIIKIQCMIRATGGNAGQTVAFIDELNATAPTAADAGQNSHVLVANSIGNNPAIAVLTWSLAEINDAGFSSVSSGSPNPATLKIYTDPNYGTTLASGGQLFMIDFSLTVVFRGVI